MDSLHRQHLDRWLSSAIPTTPGLVCLDVGSGGGGRGRYRPSLSQRWVHADLVAGHVRADVRALPFRRRAFDLVRATEMIYHLGVRDLAGALGEIRRVLRPGGRLVLSAPLLFPPINPHDKTRLTETGWRDVLPFARVEITPLGGFWTHLVTTLEYLSRAFAILRPLAWLDDGQTYTTALGVIAE